MTLSRILIVSNNVSLVRSQTEIEAKICKIYEFIISTFEQKTIFFELRKVLSTQWH
jgi:hypothetical protein